MGEERIDILNRDQFVDNVFSIIDKLSKGRKSCTFAINGDWGSGKSFVLDMLEKKLLEWQNEETATDQYMVFHYNCWQYDYYDEPLVAITAAMYDYANSANSVFSDEFKIALKSIFLFMGIAARDFANNKIKEVTSVDLKQVSNDVKRIISNTKNKGKPKDGLLSLRESVEATKQILERLAKDKTIVIVVDELDRCLPEYAIKVLERLHHLFDGIENLIVVLAVDKKQLDQTVSQIFGMAGNLDDKKIGNSSIDSYLRKFISFSVSLDSGMIGENCFEKYKSYFELFNYDNRIFDFELFFSYLFSGVNIRDIDRIIEKTSLIHNLLFTEKTDWEIMCAELIWVTWIYLNRIETSFKVKIDDSFLPTFGLCKSFTFNSNFKIFMKELVDKEHVNYAKNMNDEIKLEYFVNKNDYRERLSVYLSSIYYLPDFVVRFNKKTADFGTLEENVKRIKEFSKLNYLIK